MDFENESSASSSSCDVISINPSSPSSQTAISHKRKAGRKKFRETRHPIYRGVRQRNGDKWVCEVRKPNNKSRIWLGTFPTPEMAARAHDVAVLALRGEMARLNFPDSASVLPRPKSSSARDIQMAALQAAKVLPRAMKSSSSTSLPHVNCQEKFSEQSVVDLLSLRSCKIVVEEASSNESIFVKCSNKVSGPSMAVFVDEEALFNMPGLLNSMAEGMLLTPPAMKRGFSWGDMAAGDMELTLWRD